MEKVFETKRLLVRRLTEHDAENFFLLNGDAEVMRYIRPVKTREESDIHFRETLAKADEDPAMGRWIVIERSTGNFVGTFAVIPLDKTSDTQLGYALRPEHWGKGYATELVLAGLEYVFSESTLAEIVAVTEPENIASQKVLLKAGFVAAGTVQQEMELARFAFSRIRFEARRERPDQIQNRV